MFPTLIHIGGFSLATYGVLVAAAYLGAIYWLKHRLVPGRMKEQDFWAAIYCLFFGALAGGKLLYVLVEWPRFASGELGFIRDFRYGFVYFGGLIGALAMGLAFARRKGIPFLDNADYFSTALPMGHAVGRLGCLMAGCCYGKPSSAPWAVSFSRPDSLVPEPLLGVPLHPTQLYEAAGDAAIAVFLYYGVVRRIEAGRLKPGTAFTVYVLLYSVLRFVVELFRGDERGAFVGGLSPSQLVAAAAFAGAAGLLAARGLWIKSSR